MEKCDQHCYVRIVIYVFLRLEQRSTPSARAAVCVGSRHGHVAAPIISGMPTLPCRRRLCTSYTRGLACVARLWRHGERLPGDVQVPKIVSLCPVLRGSGLKGKMKVLRRVSRITGTAGPVGKYVMYV